MSNMHHDACGTISQGGPFQAMHVRPGNQGKGSRRVGNFHPPYDPLGFEGCELTGSSCGITSNSRTRVSPSPLIPPTCTSRTRMLSSTALISQ